MTLTTPFEDSGHLTLTTLAQESDYVAALIAQYPEVSRVELGTSVEGRPLYALKIGAGGGRPLVLVTGIHADEQCPREAALTLIRDVAAAPSLDVSALLADRALYIIPSPNPDGFPNSRLNINGVNLNREYITLPEVAPEIRAISDFLYGIDPIFVLDAHEWMHSTEADPVFLGAATFASGGAVRDAARDTALAVVEALGGGVPWYPSDSMGTGRHVLPSVGIPAMLSETVFLAASATSSRPRRYVDNRRIFEAWLDHLAAHAGDYEALSVEARQAIAGRVERTATTWPIDLLAPLDGSSATGAAVSASGYVIPEGEWGAAKALLDLHRITYDEASRTVSLAQVGAQVAVLILDPVSPFTVSPNAVRQQAAPIAPPSQSVHDPVMDLYENALT